MESTLNLECAASREWIEADGLGGFASGTASGVRTRRYHGVLLAATTPPTGRVMLVNGLEVWATTPSGRLALSTHFYAPGVRHPDGASRLVGFAADPWPTLAGVALGLILAAALVRVMDTLLFGVSAHDPGTFTLVAAIVVAVGLVATLLPAWRATRVDPITTLRAE